MFFALKMYLPFVDDLLPWSDALSEVCHKVVKV